MKNADHHRKTTSMAGLLLPGFLLLGSGVAGADDASIRQKMLRSDSSRPGEASVETGHGTGAFAGGAITIGMDREHGGTGSVSRAARAYLDYTFLSRRTGRLGQQLHGRVGLASQSADCRTNPPGFLFPLWGEPYPDTGLGYRADVYPDDITGYRIDNSLSASLEWRLDAPGFADRPAFDNLTWGEVLQISFFADYGKTFSGQGSIPVDAMPLHGAKRGLSGVGVGTGLRFSLPGRLTANFKAAYPVHSWENDGMSMDGNADDDGNEPRYWLDFSYNF